MQNENDLKTVRVMAGLAVEVAVNRWLKPKFEADTGLRLDIDWRPTAAIMKSIEAGDRADVIIGIDNSMDKLWSTRKIVQAETRVPFADSILGVGVKGGAKRPDVSTVDAFKRAMIEARGVAYSKAGASGIYFAGLIERLGIADAVNARAVVIPDGFHGREGRERRGRAGDPAGQRVDDGAGHRCRRAVPAGAADRDAVRRGDLYRCEECDGCGGVHGGADLACGGESLCRWWPCLAPRVALNDRGTRSMSKKPRIVLLHGTPVAVEPIQRSFANRWPGAELVNLLDDSLSVDRAKDPDLTDRMFERFIELGGYARRIGADAILVTCSAFGPAIERMARDVAVPVLKPNEAMFRAALATGQNDGGRRIGMLATFAPSVVTMTEEFDEFVRETGAQGDAQDHRCRWGHGCPAQG